MIRDSSFTLIELLIVIGILAVLATVAVVTLNPLELIKQSRDSNRMADLATLNKALAVYQSSGQTKSWNSKHYLRLRTIQSVQLFGHRFAHSSFWLVLRLRSEFYPKKRKRHRLDTA